MYSVHRLCVTVKTTKNGECGVRLVWNFQEKYQCLKWGENEKHQIELKTKWKMKLLGVLNLRLHRNTCIMIIHFHISLSIVHFWNLRYYFINGNIGFVYFPSLTFWEKKKTFRRKLSDMRRIVWKLTKQLKKKPQKHEVHRFRKKE